MTHNWTNATTVGSRDFICGYCGKDVSSQIGFFALDEGARNQWKILICHRCSKPNFFDEKGEQVPGGKFGSSISGIDDPNVAAIYEEARNSFSAHSYTAVVLCCRKLLMAIAVARGAEPSQAFVNYVEYLSAKGFVPPDAKGWVDHIRKMGNELNHEIHIARKSDAEDLISFSEMLLKIIFEFPSRARTKGSSTEKEN